MYYYYLRRRAGSPYPTTGLDLWRVCNGGTSAGAMGCRSVWKRPKGGIFLRGRVCHVYNYYQQGSFQGFLHAKRLIMAGLELLLGLLSLCVSNGEIFFHFLSCRHNRRRAEIPPLSPKLLSPLGDIPSVFVSVTTVTFWIFPHFLSQWQWSPGQEATGLLSASRDADSNKILTEVLFLQTRTMVLFRVQLEL